MIIVTIIISITYDYVPTIHVALRRDAYRWVRPAETSKTTSRPMNSLMTNKQFQRVKYIHIMVGGNIDECPCKLCGPHFSCSDLLSAPPVLHRMLSIACYASR